MQISSKTLQDYFTPYEASDEPVYATAPRGLPYWRFGYRQPTKDVRTKLRQANPQRTHFVHIELYYKKTHEGHEVMILNHTFSKTSKQTFKFTDTQADSWLVSNLKWLLSLHAPDIEHEELIQHMVLKLLLVTKFIQRTNLVIENLDIKLMGIPTPLKSFSDYTTPWFEFNLGGLNRGVCLTVNTNLLGSRHVSARLESWPLDEEVPINTGPHVLATYDQFAEIVSERVAKRSRVLEAAKNTPTLGDVFYRS